MARSLARVLSVRDGPLAGAGVVDAQQVGFLKSQSVHIKAPSRSFKRGEIRKQAKNLISSRFKDSGQTGYKWYYRFYVVDEYGNRSQPEFPGTESKSETEALMRQAIADYEAKQFIAKAKNITLGDMLDMWVEEELKPGPLENSTVSAYIETVGRIKKHPIGNCKLKTLKPESLQSFMDLLSLGGTKPDGSEAKALKTGVHSSIFSRFTRVFSICSFPQASDYF